MEKNTIIAIVLSALVIIVGFSLQSYLFPPVNQPVSENVSESIQEPVESTEIQPSEISSFVQDSVSAEIGGTEEILEEQLYTIETDLVKVVFTNRGGDILSYLLKEENSQGDKSDESLFIEMADYTTETNRAFSVMFGDSAGAPVDKIFNVRLIDDNSIGFYTTITTKGNSGEESSFVLAKQYTFHPDDYMFELVVTIDGDNSFNGLNFGGSAYTLKTSPQIGPKWDSSRDKYDYRRFHYIQDGKHKKIALGEGQTRAIEGNVSWAGVVGKYFTLIAVPDFPVQKTSYSTVVKGEGANAAQIYLTRPAINASRNSDTWYVYIGPRTEKELAAYNVSSNNSYGLSGRNLNQAVESSGILAPLEIVLKWIMEIFHKIIPNWGVSILFMTILMRLIIFPLTRKSSEATLKMQELQPRMKEIQEKYNGNPQKMNEEMAKLYKETGYNPLSGCLPLLIQFPLIFAMYNLFNNYFEFRGAMFIPGWIPDLSRGDSVYTLGFNIPLGIGNQIRLLPIIYVFSQLLFGKITQPGGMSGQQAGSMKFMMYGMPLIFFFIFYNAPSGLLIYWITSNLLTLVQQIIINKMIHGKKNQNNGEVPTSNTYNKGPSKKTPNKK